MADSAASEPAATGRVSSGPQGSVTSRDRVINPQATLGRAVVRRLKLLFWIGLVYVLSIGPMYWSWFRSKYNNEGVFWGLFYEPLWIVGNSVPPVGIAVDTYLLLWL